MNNQTSYILRLYLYNIVNYVMIRNSCYRRRGELHCAKAKRLMTEEGAYTGLVINKVWQVTNFMALV